ncbi:MAG TPA: class I SAM-dependent methyltransferase [Flavipsychrobacter sp.]|nr:class I SAM-dependent methyltransferase [Flavipsychrobacter sp.]
MEQNAAQPDNTAVRTALWRALHVQIDAKPPILEDELGLKLVAPELGWQERPDMKFTKRLRASIVARARFVEDLIIEQSKEGIAQYVILGAGLDTLAERRPDIASKLQIFEIDQPETLAWKEMRLKELGYDTPSSLHFVAVDFETSSWWDELLRSGFDVTKPAVVACTGVSLYLTKEAIMATVRQLADLAPDSKIAMTFYLPIELLEEEDRPLMEMSIKGASAAGTPFVSFFTPEEILQLGREAGFKDVHAVSTKDMESMYFAGRPDDLVPATGEVFLLATT